MKQKTTLTIAAVAVAAVGVLVFAVFRSAAPEAAYPVERAKVSFMRKVAVRFSGLWRGAAAAAENVRLRREIAALSMDRAEYQRVLAENARLRKSLAFSESSPGSWIAAEVLSSGGGAAGAGSTLRIGKGSLAGVREGAVVEAPQGLVGQVTSVTPHTAEVLLVTDPSLKVSCRIDGPGARLGVLSGGSGDFLVLRHLRPGAEIPPGTKVWTSGLGGVFPAGIPVGSFCTIDETGDASARHGPEGLERAGKVQPAVDCSTLEDVFVRK